MPRVFEIGGCVRDKIIGVKPNDIDYVVETESFEELKKYAETKGKILVEHPEFNTLKVKINKEVIDFTLCRKDIYNEKNEMIGTEPVGNITNDVSRRDFTMNAMAINVETGEFLDLYNGKQDILDEIIRTVGIAEHRFNEDPNRLLRAIRFSITKKMKLSNEIITCLHNPTLINKLHTVSEERIEKELMEMFKTNTLKTIELLNEFPLLTKVCLARNIWLMPTTKKKKK
jgi:tRNA nucleotidyltransferase (CCA-adding enzyme)